MTGLLGRFTCTMKYFRLFRKIITFLPCLWEFSSFFRSLYSTSQNSYVSSFSFLKATSLSFKPSSSHHIILSTLYKIYISEKDCYDCIYSISIRYLVNMSRSSLINWRSETSKTTTFCNRIFCIFRYKAITEFTADLTWVAKHGHPGVAVDGRRASPDDPVCSRSLTTYLGQQIGARRCCSLGTTHLCWGNVLLGLQGQTVL